jgi:hypothetical protein
MRWNKNVIVLEMRKFISAICAGLGIGRPEQGPAQTLASIGLPSCTKSTTFKRERACCAGLGGRQLFAQRVELTCTDLIDHVPFILFILKHRFSMNQTLKEASKRDRFGHGLL